MTPFYSRRQGRNASPSLAMVLRIPYNRVSYEEGNSVNHVAPRRQIAGFFALLMAQCLGALALQPGDIAIIGFDGKSPDDFAFVNLVPLEAGISVSFTLTNAANVVWSSPAEGVAAGTPIIVMTPKTTPSATVGTVVATGYNYNSDGDSLLAQQGATNIFVSETLAGYSPPAGLAYTNGTAVSHPEGAAVARNGRYRGPRSGKRQALLSALASTNNWDYTFLDTDAGYSFNVAPYNQPFTIMPDSTSNLTWTGTVADGFRAISKSTGTNITAFVADVQTDNNDALIRTNCFARHAVSNVSERVWFSVFFTNDCPSNIIINSVKILVQEQGAPGQAGSNVVFVSSDRTVSRWYAGLTGTSTASSVDYKWTDQETNILYDVTSILDSYQKITNCEVLVLNKGASNLYFDVFQLLVEYPLIGAPTIKNTGASSIQQLSATLSGEITSGGPSPNAFLYWGDNDGSNNPAAWDKVVDLGAQPVGSVSYAVSGLVANQQYYYRFFATNSYGSDWADTSASFTALPPSIGFAAVSNSGPESAAAVFAITLSHTSAVPVSVNYSAAGGTALGGGTDYALAPGTLIVPPGVVSTNITAAITDDTLNESNEFFIVSLATPTNATLGGIGAETYTVVDNDPFPAVAFTAASFSAVESAGNASITVSLSQPSGKPVQVSLVTSNGIAVGGSDFSATTGTCAWAVGETGARSLSVPIINDSTPEKTESFFALIASTQNCSIAANPSAEIFLLDDDLGPPSLQNDDGATGITSNSATLRGTVVSTGGGDTRVTLYYGTSDGATNPLAWSTSRDLGLREMGPFSTNVSGLASNTTYFYRCAATNQYGAEWAPSSASFLTGPPAVSFTLLNSVWDESAGTVAVDVSIRNPAIYGLPVSVAYSATGGQASNGTDYVLSPGVATVPSGTNRTSITLSLTDDVLNENNEDILISLSNAVNAVLVAPALHALTIADNDPLPVISFSSTPYSISENGTQITVRVAITPPAGRTVRVTYSTTEGTALAGVHYTPVTGTLTWTAGDGSDKTFSVPIIDNALNEGARTFYVVLASPSNATVPHVSESVTILEDDLIPPAVNNAGGASQITAHSAVLNGTVLAGVPPPAAAFYWGPVDGGTNPAAWSNRVNVGTQSGAFAAALSGLKTNTTYYYRAYATNSGGFAWATATAIFSTVAAFDYYVNNGGTSGDMYCTAIGNDSKDGRSPATPKASLQAIVDTYDLQPGDTVYIDTGTYSLNSTVLISDQDTGSAGLPVNFVGSTNNNGTIFDRGDQGQNVLEFTSAGGGNVRFENLQFTGGYIGLMISGSAAYCHNVDVVNCRAFGNSSYGDGGIVCRLADGVRIIGSRCEGNGYSGVWLDDCASPLVEGCSISSNVSFGIWLRSCAVPTLRGNRVFAQSDYAGYGIAAFDGSGATIETNECFGNGTAGIYILSSPTPTLSGNSCYSNLYDGISVEVEAVTLRANAAYANGQNGITLYGGGHILQHNLSYGNGDHALYVAGDNNVAELVNNTFCGGNCVYFNDPQQIAFSNNIVQARGSGSAGVVLAAAPVPGRSFLSDFNNMFAAGGATVGTWGGTACSSLTDWRAASASDSNSLSADPLFVDPAAGDYHIQSKAGSYHGGTWLPDASNSPSIDAADPWADCSLEPAYNGLTLNQGAYGNTVQASKTDYQGAFYSVTLVTNPPAAGTVTITPFAARYPTNRLIRVRAASANAFYTWSRWAGSLSGVDPMNLFYASSNMVAEAIFKGEQPSWNITVAAVTNGTITPPGPVVIVMAGSNQTFAVMPHSGYSISNVLVDGVAISVTNLQAMSYTFASVAANHTISATFWSNRSPLETWLQDNGLTSNGDPDNDGANNTAEFYAGTNPYDSNSVFQIVYQKATGTNNQIAWFSTTNNNVTNGFVIYRSTNLQTGAGWTNYVDLTAYGRQPVGGTNWWSDTNLPAKGPVFYQVRIPTNM